MNKKAILGDWIHAHERDSQGMKVYVDTQESLPPSRGRHHISFQSDGTFVEGMPGADDRTAESRGTYQFDGVTLVLQRAGGTHNNYEVVMNDDGKRLQLKNK